MHVEEWEELPREQVAAKHPVAYDCYDPDTRMPVDLRTYAFENPFGDLLHAYDEDGFRVIRHKIVSHQSTGMLIDLSLAHTLFQTSEDDYGHVHNDVKYTVYPLAFTRHLGNVQADGLIPPFARRMNIIDDKLRGDDLARGEELPPHPERRRRRQRQPLPGLADDDDVLVEDDEDEYRSELDDEDRMDIDMPEAMHHAPSPPLLHGVCSQIYNAISHRIRDAAKFHEVQLGLVTSSLAGTTATSLPSKNQWQRIVDRCRGDLPHVRCAEKLAGRGQPQCMRFENTYRLDVQRLPARKRTGE